MNKFFIALCIILLILACSGGNESNESEGSLLRPAVNSSIDLRLGQISSGSSPVAISAALENSESIVVFLNSDSSNSDVVYVSPSLETILVNFDQTGRPKSARTDNLLISFDNYTKENTVDVTIQSLAGATAQTNSIFLANLQIDPNVVLFLEGDTMLKILLGIDQDIDSATRALLAAAFGALRLVSCDDDNIASSFAGLFSESFRAKLCSSNLLDLVEEILENSNYQNINVNLTNRFPECTSPITYEEKKACSLVIWRDLVEAARLGIVGDYPRTSSDDTGSSSTGGNPKATHTFTPTNTPTPTPTDTPTSGSTSPLIGHWSGGAGGCPNGSSAVIDFFVVSNGDPTCINMPCLIASGTLSGDTSFPIQSTNIPGLVTAQINGDAMATFSASPPSNPSGSIFLGSANVSGTNPGSMVGSFLATGNNPSCTGMLIANKI